MTADRAQGSLRISGLRNNLKLGNTAIDGIPKMVRDIIDNNYWRSVEMYVADIQPGAWNRSLQTKTFDRFVDFVEDDTFGLGANIYQLVAVCAMGDLGALDAIMGVCEVEPKRHEQLMESVREYNGLIDVIGGTIEEAQP